MGLHMSEWTLPSHSSACWCPSRKGPQIIFPWVHVSQVKFLDSSITPFKPSTNSLLIITCKASLPGCARHLCTKSNEGVAAKAIGEGGVMVLITLDARFKKYNHPEEGKASTMIVLFWWVIFQPPSDTMTQSPFQLRHFPVSSP